tara:strand:+ start:231 stop:605 length:375 start_codon:yes stop_codon:yes gene_type:complete
MITRLLKVLTIVISFFFLTGFMPIFSIIGPSLTIITSGNIHKAGAQFIINHSIEEKTGKDSLTFFKEKINKEVKKKSFNEDLRKLVERRIKLTKKILDKQNLQKLVNKRIKVTRSKLNLNNTTQ